jgi:hypothetical protein
MTARGAVARGRKAAEAIMLDTCTIRPIAGDTTDPDTGVVSPAYGPPVYTGRCKLQQQSTRRPPSAEGGEHRWLLGLIELHLPVSGSTAVKAGHVAEITASPDPENVGRIFRVLADNRKTLATATKYQVQEVLN